MTTVIVERSFDTKAEFEHLQAAEEGVAWCLAQHRVRFLRSYLSLDGRSMVCVYDALDVESVRETQRRAGLPVARAWASRIVAAGERLSARPGRATVLVEREFPHAMEPEQVHRMLRDSLACLGLHRAELLLSHLSADGMRMICVFEAIDAESVRIANQTGGMPFTRAWSASFHPGVAELAPTKA